MKYLGGCDSIELEREIVHDFTCPACHEVRTILQPVEQISHSQILCTSCKTGCVPSYFHCLTCDDQLLKLTPRQIGLPRWDILWIRFREDYIGIELAGDNPFTGTYPQKIIEEKD